jgi:hypothetical protein
VIGSSVVASIAQKFRKSFAIAIFCFFECSVEIHQAWCSFWLFSVFSVDLGRFCPKSRNKITLRRFCAIFGFFGLGAEVAVFTPVRCLRFSSALNVPKIIL